MHYITTHLQEISENGADIAHLQVLHEAGVVAGANLDHKTSWLAKLITHHWNVKWEPLPPPQGLGAHEDYKDTCMHCGYSHLSYSSTSMSVLGQLLSLLSSILTILLSCPNRDTLLCSSNFNSAAATSLHDYEDKQVCLLSPPTYSSPKQDTECPKQLARSKSKVVSKTERFPPYFISTCTVL